MAIPAGARDRRIADHGPRRRSRAGADRAVPFPQGGALRRARQCRRDPADDLCHHAGGGARAAVRQRGAGRALLVGGRTGAARADRAGARRRQRAGRGRDDAELSALGFRSRGLRRAVAATVADALAPRRGGAADHRDGDAARRAAPRSARHRRRAAYRRRAPRWRLRAAARPGGRLCPRYRRRGGRG